MLVVRHPDQALHDPGQVFRLGTFLAQPDCRDEGVPMFHKGSRWSCEIAAPSR